MEPEMLSRDDGLERAELVYSSILLAVGFPLNLVGLCRSIRKFRHCRSEPAAEPRQRKRGSFRGDAFKVALLTLNQTGVDLLIVCILLPMTISASCSTHLYITASNCGYAQFIRQFLLHASSYSVASIAAQRFLAVARISLPPRLHYPIQFLLLFTWGISFGFSLPIAIYWKKSKVPGDFSSCLKLPFWEIDADQADIGTLKEYQQTSRRFRLFGIGTAFLLPGTFITAIYVAIYFILKRLAQETVPEMEYTTGPHTGVRPSSEAYSYNVCNDSQASTSIVIHPREQQRRTSETEIRHSALLPAPRHPSPQARDRILSLNSNSSKPESSSKPRFNQGRIRKLRRKKPPPLISTASVPLIHHTATPSPRLKSSLLHSAHLRNSVWSLTGSGSVNSRICDDSTPGGPVNVSVWQNEFRSKQRLFSHTGLFVLAYLSAWLPLSIGSLWDLQSFRILECLIFLNSALVNPLLYAFDL